MPRRKKPLFTGNFAGVDEAGRGPVLGPLVVAGVLVEHERKLRRLGVKDSKLLTPAKREALFGEIQSHAVAVAVRVVTPEDLDRRMDRHTLNRIEEEEFASILDELEARQAVVDACDVDEARFGLHVQGHMKRGPCEVHSWHKADEHFPIVGAASIIAKVTRDRAIAALEQKLGVAIGSGYSHDVVTQDFLKKWVVENGKLPPGARKFWETSRRLVPVNRSLLEFPEIA